MTAPSDLPIPLATMADGDRLTDYLYDATTLVSIIEGAQVGYALVETAGRTAILVRLQ